MLQIFFILGLLNFAIFCLTLISFSEGFLTENYILALSLKKK